MDQVAILYIHVLTDLILYMYTTHTNRLQYLVVYVSVYHVFLCLNVASKNYTDGKAYFLFIITSSNFGGQALKFGSIL